MRRTLCLLGLLGLLTLAGCERWGDPRHALRKAAGGQPLNQIEAFGRGPMPFNRVLNLPECAARLNGQASCRLTLDTGGGDLLILNPQTARELGLETITAGRLAGVDGTCEGRMALVDEVAIGDIRVARVVTFITDESSPLMLIGEGVLGTGVLDDGRVKLDFEHAELVVSPSSAEAGVGEEVAIRLGDSSHIFTTVQLQSAPATAMLDSGASKPIFSPKWLEQNYPDHPELDLGLPLPRFTLGVEVGTPGVTTCADLEFAGRRMEDMAGVVLPGLDTSMSPQMEEKIDLVIGMTIFREMRSWTVDFPRKLMWIDWLENP
jgi:predicted aspartyl protease